MTERTVHPAARSGNVIVGLVLCLAALVVTLPLLAHGPLPAGSDVYSTSHYLQGFMKAFAEGDLYPRWTDDTNGGLGAPSFVLFPPLTYYGAGAASWLTGSIISGFKLYLFVVSLLSAAAFYALARQWVGPGLPAALGSAVYLLLPYRVLDMYQRFAMSETTAFVFFPLILLFARRTILTGRRRDAALLSACYAGLIYTHIVSALSFSLFFGLWLLWETKGRFRSLLRPALALACGLGLAAPALAPAAIEKSHANIGWVREMPNGDYRINFIFRDDVLPGLGFKDPVKPPVLKSAHTQLLLAGLAAGLALTWSSRQQQRRRADVAVLAAGVGLAYFMQTDPSTFIWRVVPELASIQFPWRLQTLMVLFTALVCAFAFSAGWGRAGGAQAAHRGFGGIGGVLLALTLLANFGLSAQNASLKPFQFDAAASRSPGVVQWTEPAFTPVEFTAYRRFKQMRIEMPQGAFAEGTGQVTFSRWLSSRRSLEVDSAEGGVVLVRSFWFPGWAATLDGGPLAVGASSPYGTLTFAVPPGRHRVELTFGSTPVRRTAAFAALLCLVVTAGLMLAPGGRREAAA